MKNTYEIPDVAPLVDLAWDALYGDEAGPYEDAVDKVYGELLSGDVALTHDVLALLVSEGSEYAWTGVADGDTEDLVEARDDPVRLVAMGVVMLAIHRGPEMQDEPE